MSSRDSEARSHMPRKIPVPECVSCGLSRDMDGRTACIEQRERCVVLGHLSFVQDKYPVVIYDSVQSVSNTEQCFALEILLNHHLDGSVCRDICKQKHEELGSE